MSNPNNLVINKLTKESIAIACAELMITNSFESLTILKICKYAGVSRKAYYRNFTSVKETLKYFLLYRWEIFATKKKIIDVPMAEHAPYLVSFIYEERDFICSLRDNRLLYLLEEVFMEKLQISHASGAERYYKYVVVYTIYAFIRAMIDNDFSETPEQIIQMSEEFIKKQDN